jgi:hypothetical protein
MTRSVSSSLAGDEAGLKVTISKYLQNKEDLNKLKL